MPTTTINGRDVAVDEELVAAEAGVVAQNI